MKRREGASAEMAACGGAKASGGQSARGGTGGGRCSAALTENDHIAFLRHNGDRTSVLSTSRPNKKYLRRR